MWLVRNEKYSDHVAIAKLARRAFASMTFSDHTEQDMIDRLRRRGRLSLSKVVEHEGLLVGYVAFSKMLYNKLEANWSALGPIAVEPAHQRKGIGAALIKACIDELSRGSAEGIALVGDLVYYSRFGFVVSPAHAPKGEPAEYFQLLALKGRVPQRALVFDSAFYGEI